jgi:hypothetical protein
MTWRAVPVRPYMEGKDVVFLFTDTQIVQENFLEDINNILNSGEVPNLWKTEDTEAGAYTPPLFSMNPVSAFENQSLKAPI